MWVGQPEDGGRTSELQSGDYMSYPGVEQYCFEAITVDTRATLSPAHVLLNVIYLRGAGPLPQRLPRLGRAES